MSTPSLPAGQEAVVARLADRSEHLLSSREGATIHDAAYDAIMEHCKDFSKLSVALYAAVVSEVKGRMTALNVLERNIRT